MSVLFVQETLTTAGTIQQVGKSTVLASITTLGVTYAGGSATQQAFHLCIQAAPANTGNMYIGGSTLVKATLVGCGAVLVPGASLNLGQYGGDGVTLDQIWFDGDTSGNKILVSIVG